MRVYLYYLAGFLNMPSAQVPVLCFLSPFFSSLLFFFFCLVLCLFLYFRGLFDVGSTLAEEKKAERERRGITSWKVDVFVNGLC